ncbi:hypothetical protein V493_03668 [Pseudogymnoascus sp. VKM F-4281 (FW-2241)]|nr:hypothetical protein V493_03668 [Pseudogymnoascus sp. VKM F-4281 (FW-2241)]
MPEATNGSLDAALSPAVLHSIDQVPGLPNDDQKFWWGATVPAFVRLLQDCQYTEEHQLLYLNWYYRWIIPALGPRATAAECPNPRSILVQDGSQVEFSIKWKEAKAQRAVRFTIEPTGYEAGTPSDPLNQKETLKVARAMTPEVQGMDLAMFEHFITATMVSNEAYEELQRKDPPRMPAAVSCLAFDLVAGQIGSKAYVLPRPKSVSTGISMRDLVYESIRKWDGDRGSYEASVGTFNDYLESFAGVTLDSVDSPPSVASVAIDCVDPAAARVKIYSPTVARSLGKAKYAFALGGGLKGEFIDKALAALEDLWVTLFETKDEDKEVFHSDKPPGRCVLAVEMRPNQEPETKLYLPMINTDMTDAQICAALEGWFTKRGVPQFANTYRDMLSNAFPEHDILTGRGLHTYISFAYTQKEGVSLTTYYSPQIYKYHAV